MPAAPDYPSAPDLVAPKRALLSVSDKTGLVEAAKTLHEAGVEGVLAPLAPLRVGDPGRAARVVPRFPRGCSQRLFPDFQALRAQFRRRTRGWDDMGVQR